MRKSEVFIRRETCDGPRARQLHRAIEFFFRYSVSKLQSMPTHMFTRPVAILLTNGLIRLFQKYPSRRSRAGGDHDESAVRHVCPAADPSDAALRLLAASRISGNRDDDLAHFPGGLTPGDEIRETRGTGSSNTRELVNSRRSRWYRRRQVALVARQRDQRTHSPRVCIGRGSDRPPGSSTHPSRE